MKQLNSISLLTLLAAGACFLGSCSDDDNPSSIDTSQKPENKFSYDGRTEQLNSAVYRIETPEGEEAADETADTYTFYLSPTKGLTDVEGMTVADNFIKIASKQTQGAVDLSVEGNEISFEDFNINASNVASAEKSDLSIQMLSANVVRINIDVALDGKSLCASYYGFCSKEKNPDEVEQVDITLGRVATSYYLGDPHQTNVHNYYFVFTTGTYQISQNGSVTLLEPGYRFVIDLYTTPGEDLYQVPTGEFLPSMMNEDHTFDKKFSGVSYFAKDGSTNNVPLVEGEPIKIQQTEDGQWQISARIIDIDGVEKNLAYKGKLKITDRPAGGAPSLPQIGEDVQVNGVKAAATYYGNMFKASTGMMSINILDKTYDEQEGQSGYGVVLVLFHDLFGNPKDAKLMPGEYTPNTSFKWQTWLPAVEIPMQGMVFPFGTYAQMGDGTNFGQFSYAKDGKVTITEGSEPDSYNIEFELTSIDGYAIRGSYSGTVPVTDASDDKDSDDGTSTLERDYEMTELSKVNTAVLRTEKDIYIQGIGFRPISNYKCGHQYIEIGREVEGANLDDFKFREPGGDIFRIELCTEPDKSEVITPGEYIVQPNRWPDYIKPGVMMPGIMYEGAFNGSRWLHLYYKESPNIPGRIYEYLDGHALIYDGKVNITKAEGDNYTFEIDGICVRKHHVTGTWTGPVVNASGQPVKELKKTGISSNSVRKAAKIYSETVWNKIQSEK